MPTLKLPALPVSLLLLAACGDSGGGSTGGTTGDSTGAETGATDETSADAPTTTEPTTGGLDGDPALYQACLDYFASSHARPLLECECKVADGEYPTVDACMDDTGLKYGADLLCFCDVASVVPATADYFACYADADAELVACLEPVACDDGAAQDVCQDAHFTATMDCPIGIEEPVHDISDVLCYGVPGFMCTDGLPVPDYRRCDGQADCLDGSDELDCP